jgi:cobalt/nickel transport system permease protein
MLNFPVMAGTSGHLMGAVLTAVLLGPGAAVLVMTVVLVLQCLLFADGGLLALGANVFNMGVVAPVAGYAIYRGCRRILKGDGGRIAAVAFASWCSTVIAAICCAGELAWSGTSPWSAAFPAMAGVHMLIGLGEALISGLVIASLLRLRPELLDGEGSPHEGLASWGLLIVLGIAVFVAPFACGWPDGLEKVAATLGFESRGQADPVLASPFADYRIPGVGSVEAATAGAGVVGAIVVFFLSIFFGRAVMRMPGSRSRQA